MEKRIQNLEEKSADLDICKCGHKRSVHGNQKWSVTFTPARGHGACLVIGCSCEQFTFNHFDNEKKALELSRELIELRRSK